MYDAAAQALASLENMAARGLNPVTAALEGARDVEEWAHHPDGDARDASVRSRYYYHVHAADDRGADEHGHFHVFLEPAAGERQEAATISVGLAHFDVSSAPERSDLDGWIGSMVRLFHLDIAQLLRERDAAIDAMRAACGRRPARGPLRSCSFAIAGRPDRPHPGDRNGARQRGSVLIVRSRDAPAPSPRERIDRSFTSPISRVRRCPAVARRRSAS